MPKVVSNSSTIIHLSKINRLDLLQDFFQKILIPEAVYRECVLEGKDREEVTLIKNSEWINVLEVKDKKLVKLLQSTLDDGEAEAIALSLEVSADLILLDEYDAREKARILGLQITGLIGILLRAKLDGKIKILEEEIERLKKTGFYIGDELIAKVLKKSKEK